MTKEVLDRTGRGKHHPHLHKHYYTPFYHEFLKSGLRTPTHPGSPEVGGSFSSMRIKKRGDPKPENRAARDCLVW